MTSATSLYPIEVKSGTATTWIPLSTTFTPIPQCTNTFKDIDDHTLVAFDAKFTTLDSSYSCVATGISQWWDQVTQSTATTSITHVGLGPLICPLSWYVAQTSTKDSSTFSLCCPSGYDRSNGANAAKVLNVDQGPIAIRNYLFACVSTASVGRVITTMPSGTGPTIATMSTSTTVYALGVVGMNIGVAMSTLSASSSSTASSQSILPPATATSADVSSTGINVSNGMSTGAKAGIGVGAAVGVLVVIGIIIFVMKSKRRSKQATSPQLYEQPRLVEPTYPHELSVHGRGEKPHLEKDGYGHGRAELAS